MMATPAGRGDDAHLARIASVICVFPDFPKPGISFRDITTLFLDQEAFRDTIAIFVERYKDSKITIVAGVEARGFFLGPTIALALGAKFVPLRKPKKLPSEVISEEYILEYGTDKIEMHTGAVHTNDRAIIMDDLIHRWNSTCGNQPSRLKDFCEPRERELAMRITVVCFQLDDVDRYCGRVQDRHCGEDQF